MQNKKLPTNFHNQAKIYIAAFNIQGLVGTVESRAFDQKIKNLIRKRQNELVAYTTLDKNNSFRAAQDILNNLSTDARPEKIDAALVYINGDNIKNYTGKVENDEARKTRVTFTTEFFDILTVPQDKRTELYQFMMKAYYLLSPIKDKTKSGIQVLYEDLSLIEEAALQIVFSHLNIGGSKLGTFPNLGIKINDENNNENDDDPAKNLEKFAPVIVNNLMKVIGNNRIHIDNNQHNSTQFS